MKITKTVMTLGTKDILGCRRWADTISRSIFEHGFKVHDFMNNAVTGDTLYTANGATSYNTPINTVLDVFSMIAMVPAAEFTAKALWQPPLPGK
ncbi:MAG: hypothetical protein WDM70_07535 [Nitrosomonadales bacterium]